MTKKQWQNCTDPAQMAQMLELLRGKASARRTALFAVAACRQNQWLMGNTRDQEAVEWVENVIERLVGWNDEGGPSDGDCYLMAAPVNRCLTTVRCFADGDDARAIEKALEVVELLLDFDEFLLDLEEEEESSELAVLIRDIFGNPFRPIVANPSWLTSTVLALATGIYAERAFDRLPILAHALQDAGCGNAGILNHCRSEGPHVRGCWVVDLLLGKS